MKENKDTKWWALKSKDGKCQGYIPGDTVNDACSLFGYPRELCSEVKEVLWTKEGFKELPKINQQLSMF